jgi:hypothetical protein
LIGFRGLRVEARSEVPLEVGRTYDFRILQAGSVLRLAPATPGAGQEGGVPAPILARLLARGGGIDLPPTLAQLSAAGDLVLPAGLVDLAAGLARWPVAAQDVRRLFRDLGLQHEARLLAAARQGDPPPPEASVNLKAQLLRALAEVDGEPEAGRLVRRALASLEGLQGENIHRQQQGGGVVIPLPVIPGVKSGEVHLFPPPPAVEDEGGGAAPDVGRPFRVVFLLHLARLGPVRIDLEGLGRDMRVLFRAARMETVNRIEEGLGGFRQALAGLGLRPVTLEVRPTGPGDPAFREEPRRGGSPPAPLEGGTLVDVNG